MEVVVVAVVAVAAAGVAGSIVMPREYAAHGDKVGLGWRPELAAGIFIHRESIDLLEVIADNYFRATTREIRALQSLSEQFPLSVHGVGMGLCSCTPVSHARLLAMKKLLKFIHACHWSEHLAFVRAGGHEIGHLAAPPRTEENVRASVANIQSASEVIGELPRLENIASLIDPPCSTRSEPIWTREVVEASGASMLLDLHNLYANAVNTGSDPIATLREYPLELVRSVHLSGGHWIEEPGMSNKKRLLDDHIHNPPPEVFELLEELAVHCPNDLDVVIERDGAYPSMEVFLEQIELARSSLKRGRQRRLQLEEAA